MVILRYIDYNPLTIIFMNLPRFLAAMSMKPDVSFSSPRLYSQELAQIPGRNND